ncbi:cysteine desulfurase [Candidatus Roizmanbacteria bacterium]|nr:cysteine desulfurase [Candidatus Roizmanbacteria bacterium]
MLNVPKIKIAFPLVKNNPDLVYLDSAATSLKPKTVIDKLVEYYEEYGVNIKRGVYKLSERATQEYEQSRRLVAEFIGAQSKDEIVFTRSATESLNLVAYGFGRAGISESDEIVVSIAEHHSNFVPWQVLAGETGAFFKVIDITDEGYLDLDLKNLDEIITKKTKILALSYVSNVLGTVFPIKKISEAAKKINPSIIIVIDAAQAVPHLPVKVQELGCDFLAFSGHKMLGPTGVGILWGRRELLNAMFPFQYGGEMIQKVAIEGTTFASLPDKFEAGTPAIADAIALKNALSYLKQFGLKNIYEHERKLLAYAKKLLKEEFKNKITIYGPPSIQDKGGILSFSFGKIHPHDVAAVLDGEGVCVRAGHHCTMPLHRRLGVAATTRASFYLYNNTSDIDRLATGLQKILSVFK